MERNKIKQIERFKSSFLLISHQKHTYVHDIESQHNTERYVWRRGCGEGALFLWENEDNDVAYFFVVVVIYNSVYILVHRTCYKLSLKVWIIHSELNFPINGCACNKTFYADHVIYTRFQYTQSNRTEIKQPQWQQMKQLHWDSF